MNNTDPSLAFSPSLSQLSDSLPHCFKLLPMLLIGGLDILKARGAVVSRKNQGLLGPGTWARWGVALVKPLIHCADHEGRLESSSGLGVNFFLDPLSHLGFQQRRGQPSLSQKESSESGLSCGFVSVSPSNLALFQIASTKAWEFPRFVLGERLETSTNNRRRPAWIQQLL